MTFGRGAVGPYPTIITINRTPDSGGLPSTIAPPDHPRICSNGPGHMTNMAGMTIFDNKLKTYSPSDGLETCHIASKTHDCSKNDVWFTLTFFQGKGKHWKMIEHVISF